MTRRLACKVHVGQVPHLNACEAPKKVFPKPAFASTTLAFCRFISIPCTIVTAGCVRILSVGQSDGGSLTAAVPTEPDWLRRTHAFNSFHCINPSRPKSGIS